MTYTRRSRVSRILTWNGQARWRPALTINFVYTGNNQNYSVFDSIVYAVDHKIGNIISVSYGACEPALWRIFHRNHVSTGRCAGANNIGGIRRFWRVGMLRIYHSCEFYAAGTRRQLPGQQSICDCHGRNGSRFNQPELRHVRKWLLDSTGHEQGSCYVCFAISA